MNTQVVKWAMGCFRSGEGPWKPSTDPSLPVLALSGPPPPLRCPVVCFLTLGFPQAFSHSHWVPPCLSLIPSHGPNTVLLTYLWKSSESFQSIGMDCFFMQSYGMVSEAVTILSYPQNDSHIWVTTTWPGTNCSIFLWHSEASSVLCRPCQGSKMKQFV